MNTGKGDLLKPAKVLGKTSTTKPPPNKRPLSEVSMNTSAEEAAMINHQLEELTGDMKTVKETLQNILKREEMEELIQSTVTKVINEIQESIDFSIEVKVEEKTREMQLEIEQLHEKNKTLKSEIESLRSGLMEVKKTSNQSLAKANYNEQYSRKNNVKILNIPESESEAEEALLNKVQSMLRNVQVDLQPSKVVAIHRIPTKANGPRPVLIKLTNNTAKTTIMRKRKEMKESGNRLVDDVTKLNAELMKRLTEHTSIEQAWYFNGSVFGKALSGKRHKFDIFDNIDEALRRDK